MIKFIPFIFIIILGFFTPSEDMGQFNVVISVECDTIFSIPTEGVDEFILSSEYHRSSPGFEMVREVYYDEHNKEIPQNQMGNGVYLRTSLLLDNYGNSRVYKDVVTVYK